MLLYNDLLANLKKERAGELFRPSNVTEADIFFSEECNGCVYQSGDDEYFCLTEELSFWLKTDSKMYPIELQINSEGQPCCRRKTILIR